MKENNINNNVNKFISNIIEDESEISLIVKKSTLPKIISFCLTNDIKIGMIDICNEYDKPYYVFINEDEFYIEPLYIYDNVKKEYFIPDLYIENIYCFDYDFRNHCEELQKQGIKIYNCIFYEEYYSLKI